MEFTEKQWQGLAEHCAELGLIFLSSPFSLEALDLLNRLNVPAWKVGSGEVNNPLMLKAMAQTGKPILLSSGMSTWAEIEESISAIKKLGVDVALFQCTSKYPTDLTDVGLNVLDDMRNRFSVPVGLSDHSGSQYPALAALARGVDLVEIHVVFSKEMFGPDTQASITISELGQLVKARDAFHTLLNYPVDKDAMANELSQMRKLFNKSVAVTKDATKGQIITRDLLTVKKPGTGIPAKNLERCIGKTLRNNITANQLLTWKDIEAL
jgi:N-acetylneuraminate synthase